MRWPFLKSCSRSRLGWLLAAIHASWFLLAVVNMGPPSPEFAKFLDSGGHSSTALFAGRPFHWRYETIFLKVLLLLDVPAVLASIPASLLFDPLLKACHVGLLYRSYAGA